MIEFKTFLYLSLINVIPYILKFLPAVENFKNNQKEIKNFIGKDPKSGFSYVCTKEQKKLLDYNYTINAYTIVISSIISAIFLVIYYFGLKIQKPFDHVFYDRFLVFCSYFGLLPTLLVTIIFLRMVLHYFKVAKYLDSQT